MQAPAPVQYDATDLDSFLGAKTASPLRRRLKIIVPLIAALLVVAVTWRWLADGDAGTDYATVPVQRASMVVSVTATGNLQPTHQVEVGSELSGLVTEVLVENNERVERGQLLARIDTARLADALAQSNAALAASRASQAQETATLGQRRAALARYEEVYRLSGGKVPSATEFDAARADLARSEANLMAVQANVAKATAEVSSSQTQLAKATIRSPVTGVVLARQIDPGQTVAASFNAPVLFVIAEDLARMQLEVKVDEADVGQVVIGQNAVFEVDAFPGRRFAAHVERVDLGANTVANSAAGSGAVVSYIASLHVDNSDLNLRPGMTATATIVTMEKQDVILVPNAALRFTPQNMKSDAGGFKLRPPGEGPEKEVDSTIGRGSRQTIYVLADAGGPQPIAVTVGDSNGSQTEITGTGLVPGMRVITGQLAVKAD